MKNGCNRTQLKNIACTFMILDNIYLRFSTSINSVVHLATRFVAPLFAWLMVDGFFHTKSREKYCKRLWISAFLMQTGNVLSFAIFKERGISDNIFLTLATSFTIIWLFELSKDTERNKKITYRILAVLLTILAMAFSMVLYIPLPFGSGLYMEGGLQLIPFVLIAYFFYGNTLKQAVLCLIYSFLLFFTVYGGSESMAQGWDLFCLNSDWMIFLVIPFIFLYNGREGKKSAFRKLFFYIIYPVHLWVLALIGNLL